MTRLFVRHQVEDFEEWKKVYDDAQSLRDEYGTDATVYQAVGDAEDVTVPHEFDSADAAKRYADDPRLAEAMKRAGVVGEPQIWITEPSA